MSKIITVSREFGSGGRELGKRLADELGIAYFDKEILEAIAEKTNTSEWYAKEVLDRGVLPVPELANKSIFKTFVEGLKTLGYGTPSWQVVHCEQYGLPQHRRRLVLLASRFGHIDILSPAQFGAKPSTVRDAIGSLPQVKAGETTAADPLHRTFSMSELNLKRIRASKPGGTWRDWPEELRCPCHKKASGASYQSVYGRMCWDQPSPTMTTQFVNFGTGRFGHPEQDRALTLREAAILQSFPANYQFVAPGDEIEITPIARMIGNAVPVVIGELIGRSIFAHLKSL